MNDDFDVIEEKSTGGNWIPGALALLALVLGGAALFFALDASRRLAPMSDSLAEGVSGVVVLEDRIGQLEEQIEELAEATEALKGRVQRSAAYSSQNEKMIRKLVEEINANRERMKVMSEVSAGGGAMPGGGSEAETSDASASSSSASTTVGSYTIQPGDNFAKIAEQYRVSLQALLDANPGVDPRRLQIGQSIVLPSN